MRPIRRPGILGLVAVLAAGAGCGPTAPAGAATAHAPVARDGDGRLIYVDAHAPSPPTSGRHAVDPRVAYFHRVDGRNAAMLTFDCAWVEPANALDLLDALAAHDVKATFFISGPFLFEDYRAGLKGGLKTANLPLIRRMIDDGHEFGNHTLTHPHLAVQPDYGSELRAVRAGWEAAVGELYGAAAPPNAAMLPIWRAPYGERDEASLTAASCGGYPYHIGWNDNTLDASGKPECGGSEEEDCWDGRRMTERVLDLAERRGWSDGEVIIAHLSNPYLWGSSGELARLINAFRDHGYEFARVSEAFRFDMNYTGYPAEEDLCRAGTSVREP